MCVCPCKCKAGVCVCALINVKRVCVCVCLLEGRQNNRKFVILSSLYKLVTVTHYQVMSD